MKAWQETDNLAERIRLTMENRGFTQADLVRRTGLSPSLVSQLLNDERGSREGIKYNTVLKLKKVLGVPWSFFDPVGSRKGNHVSDESDLAVQYAEVL